MTDPTTMVDLTTMDNCTTQDSTMTTTMMDLTTTMYPKSLKDCTTKDPTTTTDPTSMKDPTMADTMIWQWRSLFQKWTAAAAVLDFTDEEWESLKRLGEADATEISKVAVADDNNNNTGALGMENGTINCK